MNIHCPKRRTQLSHTFTIHGAPFEYDLPGFPSRSVSQESWWSSADFPPASHVNHFNFIAFHSMSMSLYEFPRNWLLVSRESNHWNRPWDAVSRDIESFDLVLPHVRWLTQLRYGLVLKPWDFCSQDLGICWEHSGYSGGNAMARLLWMIEFGQSPPKSPNSIL